jgi:formyltetrahydrofolate synthetase
MFRKALHRTISKMTTTIYEQHSLAQNVMKGRAQLLYRTLIAPMFEADYDAEYFNKMMEDQRKELEKIDELFKRNDADFARIDGWLDDIKHNEGNDRVSATIAMEAAKAEEEFYKNMYKTDQDIKSQSDALRKEAEARYKKESQQTFQAQREAIRQESMNIDPNEQYESEFNSNMIHN